MTYRYDKDKLGSINREGKVLESLLNRDPDLINYLDEFASKEVNRKYRNKNYEVVVYTVGFSPYTTLLSLHLLGPSDRVIFIYTKESYEKYKDIYNSYIDNYLPGLETEELVMKSGSDTVEGFSIVSEKIKSLENKRIAIDITGGKKPTVAIGYLSAALDYNNKSDILYLDFSDYLDDRPVYGSEFITELLNPVSIFSEIDRNSIRDLYENGNYKGAMVLADNIISKMEDNIELLEKYNLEYQLEDLKRIRYFTRLYDARLNFNYSDIEINEDYLSKEELRGLESLKLFYNNTKNKKTRASEILRMNDDSPELVLYACLDRFLSAKASKKLDLQNYIIRLCSPIELCGIIYADGDDKLENKINYYDNIDESKESSVRRCLHKLRKDRNNLSINHGTDGVKKDNKDYENAVLEYISNKFAFHDIEGLIENISFREFSKL